MNAVSDLRSHLAKPHLQHDWKAVTISGRNDCEKNDLNSTVRIMAYKDLNGECWKMKVIRADCDQRTEVYVTYKDGKFIIAVGEEDLIVDDLRTTEGFKFDE